MIVPFPDFGNLEQFTRAVFLGNTDPGSRWKDVPSALQTKVYNSYIFTFSRLIA